MYRRPNRFRFLYFVRHGQYVKTEEHEDGELTEKGLAQARLLAAHLKGRGIELDAIWSSTMYRAEQTAATLIEEAYPELELRRTNLLREKVFPGIPLHDRTPPERRGDDALLDEIFERFVRPSRSERHELIACHGNLIRAITTRALGAPLENWSRMHPCHCGVTTLVAFTKESNRLLGFNEHAFLPVELTTLR